MGLRSEIEEIVARLPEERLPAARRALKFVQEASPQAQHGRTLAELAPEFFGCIRGGPRDASTNPDYLDGLGE